MKIKKYKITRLAGLIIFAYILYTLNWEKTGNLLKKTDPLLFLIAFLINIPLLGLKSYRWKMFLNWQSHYISFKDTFLYYSSSTYLGIVTPGRLGDFVKVFYLKQARIASVSKGLPSVLVDRLHDLYLLLLLGSIGVMIYMPAPFFRIAGLSCIIILILTLPALLAFKKLREYVKLFFNKIIHSRLMAIFNLNAQEFKGNFKKLINVRLCVTFSLTVAASALIFLQDYLILLATHIPITYFEIIPIMALAELMSLLPITIAGLGTREAVLLYILTPMGIAAERVILYSVGIFLISFVGGAVIGVLALWLKPLSLSKRNQEL